MTDIKTWQQGGEDTQDPVLASLYCDANTLIEGGRLVWARIDTGYATNSTYALAHPQNVRCVGKCIEHFDNTTGNAFGNSGSAGAGPVRVSQGLFLCNNDGTIVQGSFGFPVFMISDVTGTNNGLVTVGIGSGGGAYPLVGYLAPPPIFPGTSGTLQSVPDPGKVCVRVGRNGLLGIPGMAIQSYANDATVHTGAFNAVPGYMHKINPSGATFAYTFPAITAAIDGMRIAVVNVSTGSTATVAAPTGSNNVGNSAGTSTGATAAGPTGGNVKTYTADNTQGAWLVGI